MSNVWLGVCVRVCVYIETSEIIQRNMTRPFRIPHLFELHWENCLLYAYALVARSRHWVICLSFYLLKNSVSVIVSLSPPPVLPSFHPSVVLFRKAAQSSESFGNAEELMRLYFLLPLPPFIQSKSRMWNTFNIPSSSSKALSPWIPALHDLNYPLNSLRLVNRPSNYIKFLIVLMHFTR